MGKKSDRLVFARLLEIDLRLSLVQSMGFIHNLGTNILIPPLGLSLFIQPKPKAYPGLHFLIA